MKHIIYIWTWSSMSMNWAGCLNHNLHHNPSEKPRESPTTATDCETQNLARHKKYVGFHNTKNNTRRGNKYVGYHNTKNNTRPLIRWTLRCYLSGHIMRCSSMGTSSGGAAVVGSSVAGERSAAAAGSEGWWQWQQHYKRPSVAPLRSLTTRAWHWRSRTRSRTTIATPPNPKS